MSDKRPPKLAAEPGIMWKWREDIRKWFPYVRVYANGERRLYAPEQATLTAARMRRAKIKTEADAGRLHPERYQKRAKQETVQSLIDRYMPTVVGKATVKDELGYEKWWRRYLGDRPVASLDAEFLEGARQDLHKGLWQHNQRIRKDKSLPYFKDGYGRQRSLARVNRYMQRLHQVFAHPVNAKYLPNGRNPVKELKRYKEYKLKPMWAPPKQFENFLSALERHTPAIRHWMMLAHFSGLREEEQFNRLKSEVVQRGPDDWVFQIPRGKWKTDTENVPIIDLVQPIVARMLESPGPWLIPQQAPFPVDYKKPFPIQRWYKNKWEAACRAAGLPVGKRHGPEGEVTYGFTWHCARHAFAENLINEGASGKIAQRAGRWSSEAMLDRYGKTEDLLPVREAMIRGAQRWKRMYGGTAVQATKPVFDEERFRQDHPALYAQYVKMIPAEPFSSGTSLGPEGGGEPGGNTQPIDN